MVLGRIDRGNDALHPRIWTGRPPSAPTGSIDSVHPDRRPSVCEPGVTHQREPLPGNEQKRSPSRAGHERDQADGRDFSGWKGGRRGASSWSQLIVYVLAVAGVLIAAAVTDNGEDGQGFGAAAPGSTSRC